MALPELKTPQVDLGNILRTVAAIKQSQATTNAMGESAKASAAATKASNIQAEFSQEKLDEYRDTKDLRTKAAETAQKLAESNLSNSQLELITKTVDAMNNELMAITPQEYPAFLEKWKKLKVDVSGFPPPEQFENDTDGSLFDALKRERSVSADYFKQEMLQQLQNKGAAERTKIQEEGATRRAQISADTSVKTAETVANIQTEAAKERATAVEAIRSDAALKRLTTELEAASKSGKGLPGELGWFVAINGRKPANAKEFQTFRKAISTDTDLPDHLKELKKTYFQTIGRGNNALLGVDQFLPNPNREEVAKKEFTRAEEIKNEFVRQGGKLSQLGLPEPTPEPDQDIDSDKVGIEDGQYAVDRKTGMRIQWSDQQKQWVDPKTGLPFTPQK
jgi:hypothetical protein